MPALPDTAPVLLLASHGSRSTSAQGAVIALVDAVKRALAAGTPVPVVIDCFIDVQQPDVPTSLTTVPGARAVVIVPLLVSAGYHVRFDLANAVAGAQPRSVLVTDTLGPDPRMAGILADRLTEAGLRDGDQVVLAAAGSSDANAVADCHTAGEQLAGLLRRPVTVAFITAAMPRLADAVTAARLRSPGERVVVASYLLAPGTFAGLARGAGADMVGATLLVEGEEPPAALVDLVVERYRRAVPAVALPLG